MSYKTKRRLNKVASQLEEFAHGIANGLDMVVRDAATPKRVKRGRR